MLAEFTFLRPWWLLALAPAIAVLLLLIRRERARHSWHGVIAPHLLPHLLVSPEQRRSRLRPIGLLALMLLTGIVATAGPSWRIERAPFAKDTAGLVIALEVTPSMLAKDVQPTRLERAAQKVQDLLSLRPGVHAGLVAYAGSAHVAMPLTSDAAIVSAFAAELAPDVMPEQGDDPAGAVALANEQLTRSGLAGAIVLISDGIAPEQAAQLAAAHDAGGASVYVLGMTAEPDDAFARAAAAAGGSLVPVRADRSDVEKLASRTATDLAFVGADDESDRRQDGGYWLVLLMLLPALLWARRGWTVSHG